MTSATVSMKEPYYFNWVSSKSSERKLASFISNGPSKKLYVNNPNRMRPTRPKNENLSKFLAFCVIDLMIFYKSSDLLIISNIRTVYM